MARLGRPANELRLEYDTVVIGSGYGGGVAASRLSRAGLKVAVLERGREFLPGEYPTSLLSAQREFQMTIRGRRFGSPAALFDLRMGQDVYVLSGCGLGGTSLINANVCLSPDLLVFEDERWPVALRTDHYLNIGFHRAREMLAPRMLPANSTPLKLAALRKAAQSIGRDIERVPLHIAFNIQRTSAGVQQEACTECGDCMSGCNVGAKTTVHSTYLADAANHGAEIFTEVEARFVEPAKDNRWHVACNLPAHMTSTVPVRYINARQVVIAAGTLGSNEILMRSRDRGLALSDQLGKNVSTNADMIAFGYNNDIPVNAVGIGYPARAKISPPGPAVSGLIDFRRRKEPNERIAIVEAAVQSSMARLLPFMLPAGAILGTDTDKGLGDFMSEASRMGESLFLGPYEGAVRNTQVFLAVGNDSGAGEIHFDGNQANIRWPDALKEPVYASIHATLEKIVAATGGTYIPNPVSHRFLGSNLFTVHPLGGCSMSDDSTRGVVDHRCRVFDTGGGKRPDAVYEGLYVCDGSVMPRSLGIHPLLTITAIAERAMLLLARDQGLGLDTAPRVDAPHRMFVAQTATRRSKSIFERLFGRKAAAG